ncbi:MAG: aminomethyl-transferring glycine dehydrogenase subunit GcvPB [Coriobacteriia bacterium]|nr:aminomethyl-transferring glycine dehydrogenase subunit GcvPB [Coriobacteriia bacterium]
MPLPPGKSEIEVMRHYQYLASRNFGLDTGMYPLGSCTMKYNPRVNEDLCRLEGFTALHPAQPIATAQGALRLMYELAADLAEITGFAATTLAPAAGAHGEYTALMMFRAALEARGDARQTVIIPDTAHGTNPATVALCGYKTITVASNENGTIDLDALREVLDTDVAALMLTNPNTLGLFEPDIGKITAMAHDVGAFAYCDGANLNALMGITRIAEAGFDALHINLHKTFAAPHGGGGPGAGPVCVTSELAPYLPTPVVALREENYVFETPAHTIGRVRSWYGNFSVLVRAYAYLKALGAEGLREVSEQAIISANYVRTQLRDAFDMPYDRPCMHEFVLSGTRQKKESGVRTLDIAKRLLDYGFHPPTVYFPLIVDECMMIEPTETEPLKTLDAFIEAMRAIATEASSNPAMLHAAPQTLPVRRLDETAAARDVVVADLPATNPS